MCVVALAYPHRYPAHDLLQLAEYVELVRRDTTFNVGHWKGRWENVVQYVSNEDDTYIMDTIVIPGLRDVR